MLGGLLAVWSYSDTSELSVGRVSLSVSPFHRGALDAYVPLVDWGVRFPGVHVPARLQVRLDTVDRAEVRRVAREGLPATDPVRSEVRDALVGYLIRLALLAAAGAISLGALVALALRARQPRLRWLFGTTAATGTLWVIVIAVLLAPRGNMSNPVYYAHGSDIPVALRTAEAASRSSSELGAEVDNQLLGLARLVVSPGNRVALAGLPRLTIASDLHNNLVAIPAIKRASAGGPVLLAGDLSDRGTPLETSAVTSAVRTGYPVVFVGGNHDSDSSSRQLAKAGAVVLTRRGRLNADGSYGPVITRILGLRIVGYESPNMRRAADGYRDRGADITPAEQEAFSVWLKRLIGRVNVVMVHEPALAEPALEALRRDPPAHPLLIIAGHTHQQAISSRDNTTEVNGGTAGGGGTGNLTAGQPVGLAVVTYQAPARSTEFRPVAVDLVQVAPGTGDATARRVRLDQGPVEIGNTLATSPETTTTPGGG